MIFILCLGIIGFSVMGGIYFAFSAFVMKSFDELEKSEGMRAMQSINDVILKSFFMVLFFGTTLIAIVLIIYALTHLNDSNAIFLLASGLTYFVGMFLCTVLFNVPLNNELKAADGNSKDGQKIWDEYLVVWTRWNHVRTLSCVIAATFLFLIAL